MTDHLQDVEQTLAQLTRSSRVSVSMILLSAALLLGSVIYSATRLAPLEKEVAAKRAQLEALEQTRQRMQQEVAEAERQLARLRSNIENLYAVRVTEKDAIFELRASARATDRTSSQGPLYRFSVFINAAPDTIQSITRVDYLFDHPTFRQRTMSSAEAGDQFRVGYLGWGCLSRVSARVLFDNGQSSSIEFNMCQSLGPQWWGEQAGQAQEAFEEGRDDIIEKVTRKRAIDEEPVRRSGPVKKMVPN